MPVQKETGEATIREMPQNQGLSGAFEGLAPELPSRTRRQLIGNAVRSFLERFKPTKRKVATTISLVVVAATAACATENQQNDSSNSQLTCKITFDKNGAINGAILNDQPCSLEQMKNEPLSAFSPYFKLLALPGNEAEKLWRQTNTPDITATYDGTDGLKHPEQGAYGLIQIIKENNDFKKKVKEILADKDLSAKLKDRDIPSAESDGTPTMSIAQQGAWAELHPILPNVSLSGLGKDFATPYDQIPAGDQGVYDLAINEFNEAGKNLNKFGELNTLGEYSYTPGGVVEIKDKDGKLVPYGTGPDGSVHSVTFIAFPTHVERITKADGSVHLLVTFAEPKGEKDGKVDPLKGYYFFTGDVTQLPLVDGTEGGIAATTTPDGTFTFWTDQVAGAHPVVITMNATKYPQNGQLADYLEGNTTTAPDFVMQSDGKGDLNVDQQTLEDQNRMVYIIGKVIAPQRPY